MTQIKNPLGISKSEVNGVLSVRDVFTTLRSYVGKNEANPRKIAYRAGALGLGAAVIGGISSAVGTGHHLAVDGIYNIIQCLDEIDNERLNDLGSDGAACLCWRLHWRAAFC